ncbi:MAG: STAS domain-containing protein [Planctomycetes bacterium]|nr:STAS domain-containing protein [Planctomycetota bacterium]
MHLTTQGGSGFTEISVKGRVSKAAEFAALRTALSQAVQRKKVAVILNMEGCEYISSEGIGAILEIASEAAQFKSTMWILRPSVGVKKVVEALGVEREVPVIQTREEAVRSVRPDDLLGGMTPMPGDDLGRPR